MHSESYDEYIEYRRHVFFLKIGSRTDRGRGDGISDCILQGNAELHSWNHATAKINSYW